MLIFFSLFFFNAPATTEIYTLSLHDALPIWSEMEHHERAHHRVRRRRWCPRRGLGRRQCEPQERHDRSEEHTSELQSLTNLVCRLLLEKKKHPYITGTRRRSTNVPQYDTYQI